MLFKGPLFDIEMNREEAKVTMSLFQLIRNPRKFLEVVREKSFEKINCKVEPKSPSQQRCSDLQHPQKKPRKVAHTCSPSTEPDPWGLLVNHSS